MATYGEPIYQRLARPKFWEPVLLPSHRSPLLELMPDDLRPARLGNASRDIHFEIALARFSISRQRLMIHEKGSGSRRNSLSSTIFASAQPD
jgi:hypothetical protein